MTAILVAGRSGSAFAAEIGTMKVNEEVDALTVMGMEPMYFLALPKVIASIAVVPLLTIYADLLGIIGGLIVGITLLDLTVYSYIQETKWILTVFDFTSSFVKSLVFAFLISGHRLSARLPGARRGRGGGHGHDLGGGGGNFSHYRGGFGVCRCFDVYSAVNKGAEAGALARHNSFSLLDPSPLPASGAMGNKLLTIDLKE